MTITTQVNRTVLLGNGVTTEFDFVFKVFSSADLVVSTVTDGVETIKTISTDYTVSLETTSGGTVTFLTAPAADVTVVIQRSVANTQPTDYSNQGSFYPSTHERSFDRATMQIQQITDLLGRSPTLPASTALAFDPILPEPEANRYLVVNSSADGWTLSDESPVADPTLRTDLTTSGVITLKADLALSTGAALVGSINPGAAAVARTVQSRLSDKITPLDFGATGDGVADDTAELQAAIDAADGKDIDLLGLTYKVASTLTLVSDTTLKNGKISFVTAADADTLFEAFGSTGTQYTPSAAPVKGDTSIAISTSVAGLAAGDWCYLRSTDNFSSIDSGKRGEWVRVLSVVSLTVNLEQRIRHTYTTSYILYKPTLISNITLENLTLTGKGFTGSAAQYALRAYLCRNVNIIRCSADSFGTAAYSLETVLGGNITDCNASRGNHSLGTSYGVSITGGCDGITVKGGRYSYLRHAVTIGGTYFTDYGITVTGITTFACPDAGVDCHPNTLNVAITGNTIDCYTPTVDTGDGIVAQGAGVSIIGNTIRGWLRNAILCQPLTSAVEADDTWVISGNTIAAPRAVSGANAIVFSNEKGTTNTVRGLVIANNVVQAALATTGVGINVLNTTSGGPIRTVCVTGNSVYCRSQALLIQSSATDLIDDVAISGNALVSLSAAVPVVSLVNGGTGGFLTCISISGNTVRGGTYGLSSTGTAGTRISSSNNIIQGFATSATIGTYAAVDGTNTTT